MPDEEIHIESFRTWVRLTIMGGTFAAFILARPGTWIMYADILVTVAVVFLLQYSFHYYFSDNGIERKIARCFLFKPPSEPIRPIFTKKIRIDDVKEILVIRKKTCNKMLIRLIGSKAYKKQPLYLYRIQNIRHTLIIYYDHNNPATQLDIKRILFLYTGNQQIRVSDTVCK